ncbi:MAG: hypothetical protein U1E53_17455 [Dongiaceae bacterium]
MSPPAARHAVRPAAPPRPALQARLAIGSPGDAYEQEADRVAGEVMGGPAAAVPAPCSCGGGCPRCAAPAPARKARRR